MSDELPLESLAKTGALPAEPTYDSVLCWLWLAGLLGAANLHAGRVVEYYETAEAAWEARNTPQFLQLAGRTAAARLAKTAVTPGDYAPLLQRCRDDGFAVLTYEDPDYPTALLRIPDPPLVLFATGDIRVLNQKHTVGIVGARRPTQYGATAAQVFGDTLAQNGAVIVSGLADGLDSEGHRAAVRANAPTIAVQGVPIDATYPAANARLRAQIEQNGVVVSEYAPGSECDFRISFLQRNRIIAALSEILLVIEAREKSGTMSTVSHAERYDKPIYAVPGSIFSALSGGTNLLLRDHRALAATAPTELLTRLGLKAEKTVSAPEKPKAQLPETARRVLACIGVKPIGLGTLCEQTGLPTGALLGAISRLEIAGCISVLPGQKFVVK